LGVVEELVWLLAEKGECVSIRELVEERGLDWASARVQVSRALRARGYRMVAREGRVCAEKRSEDPAVRLAELLKERGCVRKPEALELLGIGEAGWRRVARRAAGILAAQGLGVYKASYWTYCIQGAGPRHPHTMTVTIPVRVDPWTNAMLEEEARKAGVSKAELIRMLVEKHLARTPQPAPNPEQH
jgi:hypothetical protein